MHRRILAGAVVAALLAVVVSSVAVTSMCSGNLPRFASGESANALADQVLSNPLEQFLVRSYTLESGSVASNEVILQARSFWCVPYARIRVDGDGIGTRLSG